MKYLFIIGLLFSNIAMAESSMYDEVMREIQAKKEAQSQSMQRQQPQVVQPQQQQQQQQTQVRPVVKQNDEEILSNNRIYKRNVADAEKKSIANEQMNNQAYYLNCMNERVLESQRGPYPMTLADLVTYDARNGFSPCPQ